MFTMSIFTYRNSLTLSLALACIAIGTALYFEHVLNYQPCALCYEERIPYYILIAISAVALLTDRLIGKILIISLGVLMLFSSLYGAYHAGVEWGFWAGPASCTGTSNITAEMDLLALVQDVKIVPCDIANWRMFGLSFAGYNAIVSWVIFELFCFALYINRAKKT